MKKNVFEREFRGKTADRPQCFDMLNCSRSFIITESVHSNMCPTCERASKQKENDNILSSFKRNP